MAHKGTILGQLSTEIVLTVQELEGVTPVPVMVILGYKGGMDYWVKKSKAI